MDREALKSKIKLLIISQNNLEELESLVKDNRKYLMIKELSEYAIKQGNWDAFVILEKNAIPTQYSLSNDLFYAAVYYQLDMLTKMLNSLRYQDDLVLITAYDEVMREIKDDTFREVCDTFWDNKFFRNEVGKYRYKSTYDRFYKKYEMKDRIDKF